MNLSVGRYFLLPVLHYLPHASFQQREQQLAKEFAGEARTTEDLNGVMQRMMKSALERMLNTELDVHLGRKGSPVAMLANNLRSEAVAEPVG